MFSGGVGFAAYFVRGRRMLIGGRRRPNPNLGPSPNEKKPKEKCKSR